MRALLGSGGFRTAERQAILFEEMRRHFGAIERILFVPYALHDHDAYVAQITARGFNAGYVLDGIHRHADVREAVMRAEGIYVGGGNTFRLVDSLQRLGLVAAIREAVLSKGTPYMGVSAGANVACPTMRTTNDMPIVAPPTFEALGLVPFQINPHYYAGAIFMRHGDAYIEHFGETRDDRIREFHEMNDAPVLGLWEGGILRAHGEQVMLLGAPARLFRKGSDPVDLTPPCDLTPHLRA